MKVTLFMAISLNGIIARKNNEEDFLSDDNLKTSIDLIRKTGCVIWGRKTQEMVASWENDYLEEINDVKKVVVSRSADPKLEGNYLSAVSPADALEKLAKEGFKEAILSGGSGLNSSFAKESLIDEIILNVEPVVIGKGISLFADFNFELNLEYLGLKIVSDKIVQLNYKVLK